MEKLMQVADEVGGPEAVFKVRGWLSIAAGALV